jgi:hypothetical protein
MKKKGRNEAKFIGIDRIVKHLGHIFSILNGENYV